jgi:hypothetical protein
VPEAPTQLDLTDNIADDLDLRDQAAEFTALELEPLFPQGTAHKVPDARAHFGSDTPNPTVESRSTIRPPTSRSEESTPKAVPPFRAAQDDALRLALQIRAAVDKAHSNTLLVCGVEPGQTVRRLARELALACVQLHGAPVLVVDVEPSELGDLRHEFFPLQEVDSATWLSPGPEGRPSAAVLRPPTRPRTRHGSFVTSSRFARSLVKWQAEAALVICCGRSVADSIATLTAGRYCEAAVLVVPASASTNKSVVAARDVCTRSGITVLGCVLDHTPSNVPVADE